MVIKFRVLLDTEKNVFRDLEINSEATFEALHYSILDAFEWEANEMASFYSSNNEWEKGEEIPLMEIQKEATQENLRAMCETTLGSKITKVGQKFIYVFDFMQMWCFYVDVVETKTAKDGDEYPMLTLSYGDTPNQNENRSVDFSGKDGFDFEIDNETDDEY